MITFANTRNKPDCSAENKLRNFMPRFILLRSGVSFYLSHYIYVKLSVLTRWSFLPQVMYTTDSCGECISNRR